MRAACALAVELREAEAVTSLERLNYYQELLMVTPSESVRASALRVINQIVQHRGDVVLNRETGKWEVRRHTPLIATLINDQCEVIGLKPVA